MLGHLEGLQAQQRKRKELPQDQVVSCIQRADLFYLVKGPMGPKNNSFTWLVRWLVLEIEDLGNRGSSPFQTAVGKRKFYGAKT